MFFVFETYPTKNILSLKMAYESIKACAIIIAGMFQQRLAPVDRPILAGAGLLFWFGGGAVWADAVNWLAIMLGTGEREP